MADDPVVIPLDDFLDMFQKRRDLFPMRQVMRTSGLSMSTMQRVSGYRRGKRDAITPSLPTLLALLQGCGAELMVVLPGRSRVTSCNERNPR